MHFNSNERYMSEHKMMPGIFYKDPLKFIEKCASDEDAVYLLFISICQASHMKPKNYDKKEFGFKIIKDDEKEVLGRISLPEPKNPPDCYEIYVYCNKETGDGNYITVESDPDGAKWVCGWTKEGAHMSYSADSVEEFFEDNYGIDINSSDNIKYMKTELVNADTKNSNKASDDNVNTKEISPMEKADNDVMFCKYCGKKISAESEFCPYCGKKLDTAALLKKEITTDSKDIDDKYMDAALKITPKIKAEKQQASDKGKRLNKKLLIIPIVLLLLVGGFAGVCIHAYNLADDGDFVKASKYKSIIFWDEDFGMYVNGGEAYDNEELIAAYKSFSKIPDYRNSNTYLSKIKSQAYDMALKMFNEGEVYNSRAYFELSGEGDSDKYLKTIDVLLGSSNVNTLKDIITFEPAKKILLLNNTNGSDFLAGEWYSSDGDWYLKLTTKPTAQSLFTARNSTITYNLPKDDYGEYFTIENSAIYFFNNNGASDKRMAFKINLIDWNTININCAYDNSTYTLYRD